MKISDGERKVMNVVWNNEGITSREIAIALGGDSGWSKTTTYTVISICIKKGYLRREDPHFHCYSLISREEVHAQEAEALVDSNFDGKADLLVAALVSKKRLSLAQIDKLRDMLQSMEDDTSGEG